MSSDCISLTQELITIPSYVDPTTNEVKMAQTIEAFAAARLPWMNCARIPIHGSARYNLILSDSQPAKLIFLSHLDTVPLPIAHNCAQ
jgi:acetylornithine deacetylase/succinyl-diaminopimelate desuccinylase-like protein